MAKQVYTLNFERVSFESEIREHPGCSTAQAGYVDWLVEQGISPFAARLVVARVLREVIADRQIARVEEMLSRKRGIGARLVRQLRYECGVDRHTDARIEVIRGGDKPSCIRLSGYYCDRTGRPRTLKPDETDIPKTWRWVEAEWVIRVGAGWVLAGWPVEEPEVLV